MRVELKANVVSPALLEVKAEAWCFIVSVSVIGGQEDEFFGRVELTHTRSGLDSVRHGLNPHSVLCAMVTVTTS